MRIGIVSPVVAQPPGAHSGWEQRAGTAELGRIAQAADRLGFAHLTCSEHVAVPAAEAERRGAVYWDPLATFGYLAARTDRIRLATQVLVLGYHHPLEIAKRYGTLDVVSGGRLTLGLGVGSLEEEFGLLGAEFAGRGARADEALAALRASMSRREPRFHGRFHDYEGFVVEPHAQQERVPFWIGGRTKRSLRRAVEHGDGWVPFGLSHTDLERMVSGAELPAGFEVVLGAGAPLDPGGAPEAARRALERTREAGATTANVALAADSADHHISQLEALRDLGDGLGLELGARR
ncbi:LLM class F420-dependent oxidoreductase [Nocardiopsis sp. HNM0947]|uniref:LLM class F420-dependent oxidoreductase n=1 Tax=Nocardiopsis coralli TaxID=2772213 RepID=A0ABR9NZV4_9ACTN|nr:LLM class F420-dependent oxidoreductase [Nocardiopsis coralli]MBE2997109.1 LLM class F420-dependent oxidoreductase [Nocardiopsis coralli]